MTEGAVPWTTPPRRGVPGLDGPLQRDKESLMLLFASSVLAAVCAFVQQSAPTASPGTGKPAASAEVSNATVIAAPIDAVWKAVSQEVEVQKWMDPGTAVDLRVGGSIQAAANAGARTPLHGTIAALQSPRMLAIQTGAPAGSNERAPLSVVLLDETEDGKTLVTHTGVGFGDQAESSNARAAFARSSAAMLADLKSHLETKGAAGATAPQRHPSAARFGPVTRLVGGAWQLDGKWDDGNPIRARQQADWILGGAFLRTRVWVTRDDGSEYQRYESIWRPDGTGLKAWSYVFDGTCSEITVAFGESSIVIPAHPVPTNAEGAAPTAEIKEELAFIDEDTLRWRAWHRADPAQGEDGWKQLIDANWRRVRATATPGPAAAGAKSAVD